jgi:hypothetical protein
VAVTDLASQGGNLLPSAGARLYREHFLNVVTPSSTSLTLHERVAGKYPDPLIPLTDPYSAVVKGVGAPFDMEAGGTEVVYIDWYVPAGTSPGRYLGKAVISASGEKDVEVPVALTVWEIDLPRTLGTAFRYPGGMRSFHGGPAGDPAPGFEKIVDHYDEALHEHRIDPTSVDGPVSFNFDAGGDLLPIDWTAYDKAVAPWLDGSRFADGVAVNRFDVGYFSPGHGTGTMTDEQYARAGAAFAEHLQQKGWWDKAYVYSVDEPWLNGGDATFKQIKHDGDLLFKYTDLWRGHILVTGPFDERIAGVIGIWCPVTPMYEDWFWAGGRPGRDVYTERLALGEKLWFYVCNANFPPYAGYDIDTAIGYEPRIVKWGTWYEKATGFLYWRTTYWVDDDPWNVFRNTVTFPDAAARNGDGFILYPGDHNGTAGGKGSPIGVQIDGPVVSYRMKQIRDGLEDWELFMLAERLGGGEYARAQVGRAYKRFGDFFVEDCVGKGNWYCPKRQPWTLDEKLIQEVRGNVAAKVLYLQNPAKYPDPEIQVPDGGADSGADAGVAPQKGGCSCATITVGEDL